ncbi:IS200/IS605 family element RNA-guided endonuclease TnpB [Bacillus thuringiensis]|uniref:IS200/IS605 family element RNA-guided endonuclease TnpB n=1 Tax=Bacillus thuringiensis TaxID=1428 RepID=A0AAW9JH01_BACTU|nr:IS200/IS605 family element RNA-guided endonuclease TnpB [Bacillus thuringiensis]MDZ5480667.1 IS200/IS605 family element RNA-guided endonuclease TnpB [Bacillus thuringiensis]
MLKAYKYRIYPNKKQRTFFSKTFGCVRFVYNKMLADRINSYHESQTSIDKSIKYPTPAQYKKEFPFLKEVDSLALANAQMNLNKAYAHFFRDKSIGFPKFKNKKENRCSYTTNNQKGTVCIENGYMKLPKLRAMVRIKQHRPFFGLIKSVTISKTTTNKYFASVLVEEKEQLFPQLKKRVGIVIGLKGFATLSNGKKYEIPKWMRKTENRLAFLQKSLLRKKKGSKNQNKIRLQIARLHEKIINQHNDFLHKISNEITNENQVIVMEDLKMKDIKNNHKLAKSISEVSWAKFREYQTYKALWKNRELIIVSKNYLGDQLCSCCGYKNKDVEKTNLYEWDCPMCNSHHDRDVNASINLLKLAM